NHEIAMNAGYLHIVTVAIWVGALLVLMLVRPVLPAARTGAGGAGGPGDSTNRRLGRAPHGRDAAQAGDGPDVVTVARRFSTIAAWSFVGVAVSGVANAALRIGEPSGLGTTYGYLLIAKTVAFGLLGLAGAWHRR